MRQNGVRSRFCCQAGKSTASEKAKVTLSEKETERIISLWSEKKVLFNSRHKDYVKNDVRQNAINRILLRLDKQGEPVKANMLQTS